MNQGAWVQPRKRYLYQIAALLAVVLLGWLLVKLQAVITPVILAVFLSYLLHPLVDRLERVKVNRSVASILILILVLLVILAFALVLIPTIITQIQELVVDFPGYGDKLYDFYLGMLAPWVEKYLDIQLPLYLTDFRDLISSKYEEALPLLLNTMRKGIAGAFTGTRSIAGFLFLLVVIPFFSFFFLRDYNKLTTYVKESVPVRYRSSVYSTMAEINYNMIRYFRGVFIVFLILTTIYIAGLSIIGFETAIAMGTISGVLYLLPYLGPAIAYILAMFLALLTFNGWSTFLWISVLYLFATQLESWVLTPRITGDQVGLVPWQVVLLIMVFASLFGVVGIIIAIPSGAMIRILGKRLWLLYLHSDFFSAGNIAEPGTSTLVVQEQTVTQDQPTKTTEGSNE